MSSPASRPLADLLAELHIGVMDGSTQAMAAREIGALFADNLHDLRHVRSYDIRWVEASRAAPEPSPEDREPSEDEHRRFREAIREIAKREHVPPHRLDPLAFSISLLKAALGAAASPATGDPEMSRHEAFHERVLDAVVAAMMSSDSDHSVAACPDCGTVLIITPGFTDHMPPLCARWAEYAENWGAPPETQK